MEWILQIDTLFESKENAIRDYEQLNPTRRIITMGKQETPAEMVLVQEGDTLARYLLAGNETIPIDGYKLGELPERIKDSDAWQFITSKYVPESVHISELVRKHLANPGEIPPKPYFVLTGVPR
ncbi:MAG: hypothetical protein ABSE04_02965 [Candidatus Microgenomates bacterium]|jgi:hypothetical protein